MSVGSGREGIVYVGGGAEPRYRRRRGSLPPERPRLRKRVPRRPGGRAPFLSARRVAPPQDRQALPLLHLWSGVACREDGLLDADGSAVLPRCRVGQVRQAGGSVTTREWSITVALTLAFWCVLMVGYGMILLGWFMGPAS